MAAVDIGPANHTRGPGHAARCPGALEGMLTQTAENPVVTDRTAAPVVLTAVTKRYGRRREPSLTAA